MIEILFRGRRHCQLNARRNKQCLGERKQAFYALQNFYREMMKKGR